MIKCENMDKSNIQNHVGIIGYGIYLPKTILSAKNIAEMTDGKWSETDVKSILGISKKHIAGENDGTQEMGALAAIDCIKNADVSPLEIDLIISFGEEWKEYPLTTTAMYIQHRIGAINAWGFDLQNRCSTSLTAIKVAKDMMLSDDNLNVVLLAGGYRNNDFVDYSNNDISMMYNLGSGGGALLLKKNANKNVVLESHFIADSSLSGSVRVEIGGTKNPITENNLKKAYKSLNIPNPNSLKTHLRKVSLKNWLECINMACEKSKLSADQIDYLNVLHVKRAAHHEILKILGLEASQSVYLENFGHVGQVDQILSLDIGVKEGKIKDRSVICMISAGVGYVWGATIVQWGSLQDIE